MNAIIVNNGRKGARLGPEHAVQIFAVPGLGAVGGGSTTPCARGRRRHHRALATKPGGRSMRSSDMRRCTRCLAGIGFITSYTYSRVHYRSKNMLNQTCRTKSIQAERTPLFSGLASARSCPSQVVCGGDFAIPYCVRPWPTPGKLFRQQL